MLSLPLSAPAVAATPAEIPAPKAEIIATESAVDLFIDISGLFKNCYTSLSSKFVADVYSQGIKRVRSLTSVRGLL